MISEFKDYQVELSGSIVYIRQNGELLGTKDVNPNDAISQFKSICTVVKSRAFGS